MGTKLDAWIHDQWEKYEDCWSEEFREAIVEYRDSRQWIEGPPPKELDRACVELNGECLVGFLWDNNEDTWMVEDQGLNFIGRNSILRHWPIPDPPTLPKPVIPHEVATHGSGAYWVYLVPDLNPKLAEIYKDTGRISIGCEVKTMDEWVRLWPNIEFLFLGKHPLRP